MTHDIDEIRRDQAKRDAEIIRRRAITAGPEVSAALIRAAIHIERAAGIESEQPIASRTGKI